MTHARAFHPSAATDATERPPEVQVGHRTEAEAGMAPYRPRAHQTVRAPHTGSPSTDERVGLRAGMLMQSAIVLTEAPGHALCIKARKGCPPPRPRAHSERVCGFSGNPRSRPSRTCHKHTRTPTPTPCRRLPHLPSHLISQSSCSMMSQDFANLANLFRTCSLQFACAFRVGS